MVVAQYVALELKEQVSPLVKLFVSIGFIKIQTSRNHVLLNTNQAFSK